MKILLLFAVFTATPFMLFNLLVVPALNELKNIYSNADTIANQAAGIDDFSQSSLR